MMNRTHATNQNVRLGCQESNDMVKDNRSQLKQSTVTHFGANRIDGNDSKMSIGYQEDCIPTSLTVSSWDSSSFENEDIDDCSLLSQCPSLFFDDDVICDCETTVSMIEDDDNLDFLFPVNDTKQGNANNEVFGINPTFIGESALDATENDGGARPLMCSMETHQENDLSQWRSMNRFENELSKATQPALREMEPSDSHSSPFCQPKELSCTNSVYTQNYLRCTTKEPSSSSWEKKCSMFLCIPDDMVFSITSFLDIGSLLKLRTCNRRMSLVASRDEAGWHSRCLELWSTKIHICPKARSLIEKQTDDRFSAMEAYKLSLLDASNRNEITTEELCCDPSSDQNIIWSFRFKESAGPDWTSWDPWWNGREAKRMIFLKDGTVMELSPSSSLKPQPQQHQNQPRDEPFLGQANFALRDVHSTNDSQTSSTGSRMKMRWRFIEQPMDLPHRPHGSYIRLTIGGRDVPTYVVRRSPTGNWGFILESCWGVYASFTLPKRNSYNVSDTNLRENRMTPPTRDIVALNRRTRMRIRRTNNGARWINVEGIESDDSDFEEDIDSPNKHLNDHGSFSERVLTDDKYMTVTNFSQWREALLYNHGARSLPYGKEATEEFDRAWRNAANIQTRNNGQLTGTASQQ